MLIDPGTPGRFAIDADITEADRKDLEARGIDRLTTPIYQAIYSWAHNNRLKVVPDASTSGDGNIRRNAHSVSSALRFGSAEHIIPTDDQFEAMFGRRQHRKWAEHRWATMSFEEKLGGLLQAEMAIVEQMVPGLDTLWYDATTDAFYEGDPSQRGDSRLSRDEARKRVASLIAAAQVARASGRIQRIPIGPATLGRYFTANPRFRHISMGDVLAMAIRSL